MNTVEKIRIMQAWLEGKKIRYRGKDQVWMELNHTFEPTWNWEAFRYEVAPEPREIWVNFRPKTGYGAAHTTEADALAAGHGAECVHFREVIDGH